MKAITYFNQKWFYMVDEFFLKTLPPDMDLHIKWLSSTSSKFGDDGFKKVCSERMRFINEIVQATLEGEIFVAFDSDMTFFVPEKDERSISQYITDEMQSFDMGFQAELDGSHNIGIWAIRCTSSVKQWFVNRIDDFTNVENDQIAINTILQAEKHLNVKNFHPKVFCGVHLNQDNKLFLDREMRIFHATVFQTVTEKCTCLVTVREAHQRDS